MQTFTITPTFSVGEGQKLLVIAGPCQIESEDHALSVAEVLSGIASRLNINLVYKSSYDKANRTSISTQRGVGIEKGLSVLAKVREVHGLPVLTDVHTEEEAQIAGELVDIIQIPAFLCRQTDLLLAAGRTGKTVNVKKGQFLAPPDMKFAAEKISSTGNNNILLCERGSCFGYRDLIVDMRSFPQMRGLGYPVVFDATHSVQNMGGAGGSSGGNREYVPPLLRAAIAVGVDGIFIECHEAPDRAPSDGPNMIPLNQMEGLLTQALRIREAVSAS